MKKETEKERKKGRKKKKEKGPCSVAIHSDTNALKGLSGNPGSVQIGCLHLQPEPLPIGLPGSGRERS